MLSGKENPRGGPSETAFKRAPVPTLHSLSRRDMLRAGVALP